MKQIQNKDIYGSKRFSAETRSLLLVLAIQSLTTTPGPGRSVTQPYGLNTSRNSSIASSRWISRARVRLHLVRLLTITSFAQSLLQNPCLYDELLQAQDHLCLSRPLRIRILAPTTKSQSVDVRTLPRSASRTTHYEDTWVMQHAWWYTKWSLREVRISWRIWRSRDYTEAVEW